MDLREIRENTRTLSKGACRACPVCDGKVCAGEVPGMGGAGTGVSFKNNVTALSQVLLNCRLIHNVRHPKTETSLLGLDLSLPLIVAPIGGISFNLGEAMPEADYQAAVTAAAVAEGIVAGLPDAVPVEVMQTGLACAKAHNGRGIPFVKPWEMDAFVQKIDLVAAAGCTVMGCDLDSIGLITPRKMGHPLYAKDGATIAAMVEQVHARGMRFIIKGVMAVEDALACVEAGVDGIVVSNHGGRVLDCTPGTADVLPQIAASVSGRIALLADGGVRTGVDILKMLALGADCVMIGRPFAMAAVGGGAEAVSLFIRNFREQLEQAMIMTGCPDVAQAGPHLIY